MRSRSRWLRLGSAAVVAAAALASINPPGGLPYVEDFEDGALGGWTLELDAENALFPDYGGRAWYGRGALVARTAPPAPNAAVAAGVTQTSILSVRFFLFVTSGAENAIAPGIGSIRLVRLDGQAIAARLSLDLMRGLDNVLYLVPKVSGVAQLPAGSPVTSITAGVYHYVELGLDSAGNISLYIDDPRVPRHQFLGPPISILRVAVGIAGEMQMVDAGTSTARVELVYDDLTVSDRHVGLAGTRSLVANEYDSPGVSGADYPAGKGQSVMDAGSPPPEVVTRGAARHRGSRGLSVTDQDGNPSLQGAAVFGFLDRFASTPVYRRAWWRWESRSGSASHTVLAIGDSRGQKDLAGRLPAALRIRDDGVAQLWGMDDLGPALGPIITPPLPTQTWHLLELYAGGFGEDAGERRAWVNGQSVGQMPALFRATAADQWIDGFPQVQGEGPFRGVEFFDDARTSTWIQPSHFELRPNAVGGECDAYDVVAYTSDGVAAPVPETADVTLDAGTGIFHAAPTCLSNPSPVGSVKVYGGTLSSAVWFKPATGGGGYLHRTSSPDYLPWQTPAGSVDGGPSSPASSLRLWGLPKVAVQNQGFQFAVEALDDSGNTATGYSRTVIAGAGPTAPVNPGSHAFGPLDQGYFVFSPGVQFQSPGIVTLAAADGTLSTNAPVEVLGPDQVAIVDDASRFAVAGAPYRYNSTGAVTAVSTAGVPQFQTCPLTPPGFDVDPQSGAVDWTPSAPGMVSVCLQANAGFGPQDVLAYTIDVAPGPRPGPPDAGFVVRPPQSAPGAFVVLDPRGTRSQVGPPLFRWRFGDGAWPSTDPKPFHRYLLPGGYRPHLTVRDGAGQSATADRPLQVGSAIRLPPTVRISSAQPLQGRDWLDATLSAEVTQGTGPSPGLVAFRWDLGDGTSHSGTLAAGQAVPDAPAGYGPGRYFAQLLVLDGDGMTASDKVEVVVTRGDEQPPDCLATVEPTALFLSGNIGRAAFRAFQLPGTARLIDPVWTIDGQPSSGPVAGQTYDAGGWHDGALVVRDEAGLLCKDELELAVIPSLSTLDLPPRIIHPGGGTATCGKALEGEAPVVADPAGLGVTWSLAVASPGGAVDSEGRLSWTPPAASSAPGSFVLVATGAAGSDRQAISVPVECPDSRELGTTCGGCGAGGGSPLLALAAWGLLARARRRPTASRRPAAPPR